MKKIIIPIIIISLLFGCQKKEVKPVETPVPTTPVSLVEPVNHKPYAPITVDNSKFVSSWAVHNVSGNISLNATFDTLAITSISTEAGLTNNIVYHDGISLKKGETYTISFLLSSSIPRDVEIGLYNSETFVHYKSETVHSSEEKVVTVTYQHTSDSVWCGRLQIGVGGPSTSEHTITIKNLMISSKNEKNINIYTNHLGYFNTDQKRCVLPYNQGDMFVVINKATNNIVYRGALINQPYSDLVRETTSYGDFTNILDNGTYYIKSQLGGISYDFNIKTDLYNSSLNSLLKMISLQRCGHSLDASWAKEFAHEQCHMQETKLLCEDSRVIDVTGGWHDAGDFGRYTKTGVKTVNELMLSYLYNPSLFTDTMGIAESGNNIPDILDEAKIELDWLMKMQADYGAVFTQAVTVNFPTEISPTDDHLELVVLGPATTATAGFISSMSIASIAYRQVNNEYATLCLERAKKGWENLINSPKFDEQPLPEGINSGIYRDTSDKDERFFAAIALWKATYDSHYLDYAKTIYYEDPTLIKGISWRDVGSYGKYIYLTDKKAVKDTFYSDVQQSFIKEADAILAASLHDSYFVSLYNYSWGSNGTIAENAALLIMANDVSNNDLFRQSAISHLDYLFGRNSLNRTFISTIGHNSPTNMHHRTAIAINKTFPGALVGGPNNDREDPETQQLNDIAPAKCYVDKWLSYSTNEVTIYWNSSLIHAIAHLEK